MAAAAVRLDGVEQLVLTTGTPATADRGAAHLAACAAAVRAAVPGLPIQVQCEPPDDFAWFARLAEAGADTLGMHLEAVEPAVRAAVMPGKAEVPVEHYLRAYAAAVAVFGRGQVSTYLIAGLGDRPESLVAMAEQLLGLGVYPFLVPFAPIAGTGVRGSAAAPGGDDGRPLSGGRGAHPAARHHGGRHEGRLWKVRGVLGPGGVRGGGVTAPADRTFACRLVRTEAERQAYFALRRAIFCDEQGLFAGDDCDTIDERAHPIVCLHEPDAGARVVGVVRIWEAAPGDWWGGRLGVAADVRSAATVGRRLIQTAVGTARAWGAWRFRATVQQPNVAFFRRLRWTTVERMDLLGQPHHLMQADLSWYAPVADLQAEDRDAAA